MPPRDGWHLTDMFAAMRRGELRALYVIGENPAQSEAESAHAVELLEGLDHLVVQDIFLTKTAQLADVVLPGSASWCESNGTVTNSERRVQLVRKALDPPGEARDDVRILIDLAAELGHCWDYGDDDERAERVWDELRSLSPMHAGMSYARLAEHGGIQWPCYSEDTFEPTYLHGRLWADDAGERGRLAPFSVVVDEPPVDELDEEFPLRLTTGRRLDSYNTGVQSGGFRSPNRRGETIDLSPEDARRLGIAAGEVVRVSSRRGRGRGAGRHRRRAPTWPGVHDDALPRRGGHQPADDRGRRPEVGHVRVQGHRRARRPARMDLKIASAAPTDIERAAVASVLGPAPPERDPVGLHVRRAGGERHRLLDVLHAVNDRVGWISRGAINHIAERLDVAPADIYGVATFYALFSTVERPPHQVHVCVDLVCRAAGGPTERNLPAGTIASPCLGVCERAPARSDDDEPSVVAAVPQVAAGDRSLELLGRIGAAGTLDAYRAAGGYEALRQAFAIGPAAVIEAVTAAGLVGRGGAAFPTGRKWDAVARQPVAPAPSRLQRRRVRAGNLQGPRADGGRPLRRDRVDDDRRLSPPAATTGGSTCAASTCGRGERSTRRSARRAPARVPRRRHPRQ